MVGTFKIITTAAIEEGVVDLDKDTFYDTGSVIVSGARIGCWKSKGHGYQTFLQVHIAWNFTYNGEVFSIALDFNSPQSASTFGQII